MLDDGFICLGSAINAKNNNNADISTLIRPENNEEELNNPNLVKCVISNDNFALDNLPTAFILGAKIKATS